MSTSSTSRAPSARRGRTSPRSFPPLRRVQLGVLGLVLLVLLGSFGFMLLGWYYGHGDWSFLRCLYMTVITVTTIGYGDILGAQQHTLSTVYNIIVALVGMGASLYVISMATAFIIEGDLKNILWSRRMSKRIKKLSGHFIVCGVGQTGIHAVNELVATDRPFVAIDSDERHIRKVQERLGVEFPVVLGEATDDDTLLDAGVERAAGLIAALAEDRDNVFLTLTARQLNPGMRIVAKGTDMKAASKLCQAGADSVVSPTAIGGLRIVSELLRPETVTFLDTMLRDHERSVRFEDLCVGAGGEGRSLAELKLGEQFRLLAVAVRWSPGEDFDYCPDPKRPLQPDMTLVVLGEAPNINKARAALGRSD